MRRPRILAPHHHKTAFYHCVSRVVNRDFVLGDREKQVFLSLMRLYEGLYGLRILSYCLMSNHFHILVEVPQRPTQDKMFSSKQLVEHVRLHLGGDQADSLAEQLQALEARGALAEVEELCEKWFSRMWCVSSYMKVLKQRFTQWFNRQHKRKGTLWEDRFRSVLVENEGKALRAMAAYIDLNPVRAGICDDPKDYRWCGYGEALGNTASKRAQEVLMYLASLSFQGGEKSQNRQPKTARQAFEYWRRVLYGLPEDEMLLSSHQEQVTSIQEQQKRQQPDLHELSYRKKVSKEKALQVLQAGGRLSEAEYLRCRVRYFCDGAVLGGKAFVEEIFRENKKLFGESRKDGARLLKGLELSKPKERLYNLRNLQKDVFS